MQKRTLGNSNLEVSAAESIVGRIVSPEARAATLELFPR
jgi:hypothetical protein